ncbi:sugar phosphate isomerase/epimerase family protein [Catenuloplanes atrovinosus]|uniref:Sugar phosphate isomerase/epimerase n=1 Tax=Catenuloplanes atrovinosus TaxID=137266 RepID=A0AAE4CBZ7_9ACTN|nr:sugar phosphate isomerase/epimerase family protein [Catenuloplanes atrovinosus]MDR7277454.1 sugar phosphate isomerase/epimerase [Catenuloplanes atrovinosus]
MELMFTNLQLTGTLPPEPPRYAFAERVAAVAEAGATGIGVTAAELDGIPDGATHQLLDGHGVRIVELEAMFGWFDGDTAPEEALFRLAETYRVPRIKTAVLLIPPAGAPDPDVLAERFAGLCDRAAAHGTAVALEPVVVLPGFGHAAAHDLIRTVDRPNAGLMFDAWHVFRDPSGPSVAETVAARHVAGLELTDGLATPGPDLMDDCVNRRMLPGDGEFDLAGLLRTLRATGAEVPLSVEVLSAELRELTPREHAARVVAAVTKVLEA